MDKFHITISFKSKPQFFSPKFIVKVFQNVEFLDLEVASECRQKTSPDNSRLTYAKTQISQPWLATGK